MLKRTFAAVMTFVALLYFTIAGEAATSNNWLIYWYVCGTDLETNGHGATNKIAEMEHVKLPANMKILICAGGTTQWHHPTIQAGGEGYYLYSSNRLEKVADFNEKVSMGDPATLANFLKFGEDNIRFGKENSEANRRIIIFTNHGGLGGVCYDENFVEPIIINGQPLKNNEGKNIMVQSHLNYDELNNALTAVYGNSPETTPFELVEFDACLSSSYELANSISNFSHYMLGAEPSIYAPPFKEWIGALAKNTSMDGVQIGKIICDSAMKDLPDNEQITNIFSVIDLTKMPQLRNAYEEYFDEALNRSDEKGFLGAFARAAESRNADKYSNLYTDLGLLAKNTKSIMPKTSADLLTAIDKAVVYNKRGKYLNSKGISTYYPYISSENIPLKEDEADKNINHTNSEFIKNILSQNSNYKSQKELYRKLLNMQDMSALTGDNSVVLKKDSNNHLVANLNLEQLGNISSVYSVLMPVKEGTTSGYSVDIGGSILASVDDLKIDFQKGIITEKFSPKEPLFDGHKIVMMPLVGSRGYTFYKVPIIYNGWRRDLIVSYDTSKNTYSIIGFGSMVENGVVRTINSNIQHGAIITPLHLIVSNNDSEEQLGIASIERIKDKNGKEQIITHYASSLFSKDINPDTGEPVCLKWVKGDPIVYTRNATITNTPITKGMYLYFFKFASPSGYGEMSMPGIIVVDHGKIHRFSTQEMAQIAADEQ